MRTQTFEFDGAAEKQQHRDELTEMIVYDYQAFNSVVNTATVQQAYDNLADTNKALFEEIPVGIMFVEEDPYSSYEEMCEEVERTDVLKIFSGGSHPDQITPKENLKGRAVYDWFGHIQMGVDFSLEGEWAKWRGMRDIYSENAGKLLFTEVVAQQIVASELGGYDADGFEQRGIIAPRYWLSVADSYMKLYNPHY